MAKATGDNFARAAYLAGWVAKRDQKSPTTASIGNSNGKLTLGQKLRNAGIPYPTNSQIKAGASAPPAKAVLSNLSGILMEIANPPRNPSNPFPFDPSIPVGPFANSIVDSRAGDTPPTAATAATPAALRSNSLANVAAPAENVPNDSQMGFFLNSINPLILIGAVVLFIFWEKKKAA